MKESLLKTIESDSFKKGVKFIGLFLLYAAIAGVFFYFTPLEKETTRFAAKASQQSLQLVGISANYIETDYPHLVNEDFDATINEVCSGGIELIVLFGIIFASFEKPLRERIKGFLVGVIILVIFNLVRITATIYFLSDFLHSFFFRVTLVIVIVLYYWFWFYEPLKQRKG
ncbi:exosortase/archaeosortase family protein [Candidatus Micrarchaeota archaeon]|nr:exosortase/archaeosortase family protein [Candidatus Micrarchaeota archaeon]